MPAGVVSRCTSGRRVLPAPATFIVLGLIALGPTEPTADSFDEQTLRRSAASIAQDPASRRLLSAGELTELEAMAGTVPGEEIDRLLSSKTHILISINPEARLRAQRTRVTLPKRFCGTSETWLVRIVNDGYVTARLTVGLAALPGSNGIRATLSDEKLSGGRVEYRLLTLLSRRTGPTDVTLLFGAGPDSGDLGARARLHVLVAQCEASG